jgi:methylmalonyl-CoA mutase cobalamin-binding domain/chain
MAGFTQQLAAQECWEEAAEFMADGRFEPPGVEAPARDGADRQFARLVQAIEAEIVPRLVLARRGSAAPAAAPPVDSAVPTATEVSDFARLVLVRDAEAAFGHVDALRGRGTALETLLLKLLAPAARRLGDWWCEDRCDFTQVTTGLWRLHQVLRHLSPPAPDDPDGRNVDRRALLVPLPGEQHSFGAAMVAEFFRQAGWNVWSGPVATADDLLALAAKDWFAVIGVSVGGEVMLASVSALVRTLRRASRNRSVGVMVGGPIFNAHPELVARVGADATAADGRQAVARAEDLLALLPQERA